MFGNNPILKDKFICHLVYEHDFIQQFNNMIVDSCDLKEHLFIVYATHAWNRSKKYHLSNSYYIDSFYDRKLLRLAERSVQVIVHCLYTPELTDFLYRNQHLLYKVNWKLWGGDLYLYRQVGSVSNTIENEAKRKEIIRKVAYITSPIEEEWRHALDIYGGHAQHRFAFYPLPKDFREYRSSDSTRSGQAVNIFIGNSGYPTSNHLQAFSFLKKFKNEEIRIFCPLSYGDAAYTEEVCKEGRRTFGEKFTPLLDFIPFDDYVGLLNSMDIALMNHDRQQGLGNILIFLYLGKKVYMQPDVTTFRSLSKYGAIVHDIRRIEQSNSSDLTRFSKEDARRTSEIIQKLFSKKNCVESWRAIFAEAIRNRRTFINNRPSVKRVLFVNHNIFPLEVSGTPLTTLNHAIGMVERGMQVAVLIPSFEIQKGYRKNEVDGGFILYQIPATDKLVAYLTSPYQSKWSEYSLTINSVIEDFQPQVVHINDYVYMPAEIMSVFSSNGCIIVREVCNCEELCHRDYPVISSKLDDRLCSGPENAQKCTDCLFEHGEIAAIDRTLCQWPNIHNSIQKRFSFVKELYANVVDKVVFTCEPFGSYFRQFVQVPDDKVKVIPRGFKFEFGRTTKKKTRSDDVVHFAFIGNIMFSKGVDIVLKAFEKVCTGNNLVLHLYGNMINEEFAGWINKLQINRKNKFIYHGSYKTEQLSGIASDIDVCIISSYFDTYNRVVREALYLGIPIIATDFFGAYVVENGKNGFKIPIGDADALAETMKMIVRNSSIIDNLAEGARQTPIPSLEEEIDQLVLTYEELWRKRLKETKHALDEMTVYDAERAKPVGTRLITFYLPQFHPIPENDSWWGEGFTEWTNVVKAKPRFFGHYQPHIPSELGFYDLRSTKAREMQVQLAKEYGIEGFCYWHYWFMGKRLLERPFDEVLESGTPDYPFCLAWANENWTRSWDGAKREILQEQKYGAEEDNREHFNYLVKAWSDSRALKIDDKPIFLIYRPADIPNITETIRLWRELAKKSGIKDIYFIAIKSVFEKIESNWLDRGFDGEVIFQPNFKQPDLEWTSAACFKDDNFDTVVEYEKAWHIMAKASAATAQKENLYACVVPSWDNSPRRDQEAFILHEPTPREYQKWLKVEIDRVQNRSRDKKIVFINAWNEWAEGNHLEPDLRNGRAYLEATKAACTGLDSVHEEMLLGGTYHPDLQSRSFSDGPDCQDSMRMYYEAKIKTLEDRLNLFYSSNGGRLLLRYYKLRDRIFPKESHQKYVIRVSKLVKTLIGRNK